MAGWTGKRVNVSFNKPEEPSFLKKFKERVGYKEDHGLQDKFAVMPNATDEDLNDREDELPQVVSLHSEDLTQEEVNHLRKEGKLDELLKEKEGEEEVQGCKERDEETPPDGKIYFRKPAKRSSEEENELETKKLKEEGKSNKKTKKSKKEEARKIKLLSFNEDDEDI